MRARVVSLALITALSPAAATLAVQEPDTLHDAFTVQLRVSIDAAREEVYRQLVGVGDWWSSEHTFFGDASRLSLQPRPGGCFCETQPDGRWVEHMHVVNVNPAVWIRMTGALGPLQEHAVTGVMTISLEDDGSGTSVRLVYRVTGHVDGGLEGWEAPVATVLQQQLDRLERLLETGSPEAPEG